MKNQQQEQARQLYMQTNQSKTEIAATIGVDRRTIYQWSVEGDWDTLRISARCIPAILAQKCYHLIGHYTNHLLQCDPADNPITKDEVNILHRLVTIVAKLKAGSTVSDNMETFTLFLEGLKEKDAGLAHEVLPHITDFVTTKSSLQHNAFLLDGYGKEGSVPYTQQQRRDNELDEIERAAALDEQRNEIPAGIAAAPLPQAGLKPNTQNTVKAPPQYNQANYPHTLPKPTAPPITSQSVSRSAPAQAKAA